MIKITPRQFLKLRRPEQFSDSSNRQAIILPRHILESYLLNLTSRNDQDLFEHFARRLCELELCPNIKPNTGPSGGGDGGTDAETYPVSADTASGWYIGHPSDVKEKYAFAFSAKKKWKPKLESDVKSISERGRMFTDVYFVSSRYIKASECKALEFELSKLYSMSIHIFDLTWILNVVYDHNRLPIVVAELGIDVDQPIELDSGPVDVSRAKIIKELELSIEDSISKNAVNNHVVRDSINVAILSREQELPRHEVEGKFDRAVRLADKYGSKKQHFNARYQKCWTAFWWLEDIELFKANYTAAEKYALELGGIDSLEQLSNLRQLLAIGRKTNPKIISKKFIELHTEKLEAALKQVAIQKEASSSALYAETLLEQITITDNLYSRIDLRPSLIKLKKILTESQYLSGFPMEPFIETIKIIGGVIGRLKEYDDLFDKLTEITTEREGEKAAGKLILERAKELIKTKDYYKSIQILGSALPNLHKEEIQDQASEALLIMGNAYEEVGLLWAARGSYLGAASVETSRFWKSEIVTVSQLASYGSLIGIELTLRRLPQVFQWMEILNTFVGILSEKDWNIEAFYKRLIAFDLSIGSEILTSDINADMLNEAIAVMQRLDLEHSVIAAAYRLDRKDLWPDMFIESTKDLNLEEYFQTWAQQSEPMTEKTLQLYSEEVLILKTHVAGCEITLECPNVDQYIITAESILAATESLLSTVILYHGIATEPQVKIVIKPECKQDSTKITHEVVSDSELVILVSVSKFNPFSIDSSIQEEIANSIMHICVSILANIMIFKDTKDTLDKLLSSERAFVRSIGYTSSFIRMGNVVGYKPKYRSRDWSLKTDKHADEGLAIKPPLKNDTTIQTNDLPDIQKVSHKDITTASIIRLPLWDKAKWRGVMYAISPENTNPPVLALLFEDADTGRRIFEAWNNQFGPVDKEEAIRIAILKGIDSGNPLNYRVGISRDMEKIASPGKIIGVATRSCTMTPTSSENLDRFISSYKKQGLFGFTFAIFGVDGYPHIQTQNIIIKKKVQIREATEVGDNDPDIVLLGERKTNKDSKM